MNDETLCNAVVFISGPMTGIEDFNRPKFNRVAAELASAVAIVLNPAVLPDGLNHEQYLALSLQMLKSADVIYQLEGWSGSEGAMMEAVEARLLGLPFFSESLKAMSECAPSRLELPKVKSSVRCAFCHRSSASRSSSGLLFIAGPVVSICQDCVEECNEIIAKEGKQKG